MTSVDVSHINDRIIGTRCRALILLKNKVLLCVTSLPWLCLLLAVAVAGLPWMGPTSHEHRRNNLEQLQTHLDATHGRKYLVVNLARHRFPGPASAFHNQVLHFPPLFDDVASNTDDVPSLEQVSPVAAPLRASVAVLSAAT